MHIAKHTPLGILIVLCIGNHAQWILALRVGTKSLSILAVFCIDGEVGVKLQSVLQHTTRSINTLRTVDGEVLTNGYQIVNQFIVCIGTARKTVEPGVLNGTFIIIVTYREERITLLRAIAY